MGAGWPLDFEQRPWKPRLSDNRSECADSDLVVVGNRYRHSGFAGAELHDDVTALPAHFDESVCPQERADGSAGQDLKLAQQRLLCS